MTEECSKEQRQTNRLPTMNRAFPVHDYSSILTGGIGHSDHDESYIRQPAVTERQIWGTTKKEFKITWERCGLSTSLEGVTDLH